MKIAIVYNRESQAVINLFGTPNREKYGLDTIKRIQKALIKGGHQVKTFEGDKNFISSLEKFMPAVITGERPGLVFNLSYGIQGKGRYMHMPGILEMLGIPYVGSGPESHALALDKVLTKMILIQKGLPTPAFAVLDTPESPLKENLKYPLIVKPKSEAVSFGLRIVNNEDELREGVKVIYEKFNSPTLVEEFIEGREFNVGLLGNGDNLLALPPLELVFGEGEQIYTFEDKTHQSGREVEKICPAPLTEEQDEKIKKLSIDTFNALGLYDSARVDFRMDKDGNLYILEVNSMASLGSSSSYIYAAEKMDLNYDALMNRLVEVASERYFGPYNLSNFNEDGDNTSVKIFNYITKSRDKIENDLRIWTNTPSWTDDPAGLSVTKKRLKERLLKLGLVESQEFTNSRSAWTYETKSGFKDGLLFVVPVDIPGKREGYPIPFRTEEEWLFGEGIASSRSGIVTILGVLNALKETKNLTTKKIGVFFYTDEGRGMRYSHNILKAAAKEAKEVFVLQPGFLSGKIVDQRRGSTKYSLIIEGDPQRIGNTNNQADVLSYFLDKAEKIKKLSCPDKKLTVAIQDLNSERYSVLLPHRVNATLYITYLDKEQALEAEEKLRKILASKTKGVKTYLQKLEERPPLLKKRNNLSLKKLAATASDWNIPFGTETSLLPSAAGEIDKKINVLCGFSPASNGLYTPNESIRRKELVEKILLLALYITNKD